MSESKSCEFKNITTSVNTLKIKSSNQEELKSDIKKLKKKIKEFFDTTPIILDFLDLEIKNKEFIEEIYFFLKEEGFIPIGVKNIKDKLKQELRAEKVIPVFSDSAKLNNQIDTKQEVVIKEIIREVPIEIIKEVPIEIIKEVCTEKNKNLAVFDVIRRGQKVINKEGDIQIFAKVNNGGEIYSTGSVVITDTMEGTVYAGVPMGDNEGNPNAYIFMEKFNPVLISINGIYKHFEIIPEELKNKKVLIKLEGEKLIFKRLEEGTL